MIASDADSDNGETGFLANSSQGSCSPPVVRLRHYTPTNPMIRTLLLASIATISVPAFAHDATAHMAKAASTFLESLTPEQKTKATFAFKTEGKDERFDWHFVPKDRKGLPLKEMTEPQRKLAKALLKTGLSADGYQKAETIQSLEVILRDLEKDTRGMRDPDKYYVTIFGAPGAKEPWGWRWEGHHQSFNYTCIGQEATMTPSFFGSNPGTVPSGPQKGMRVLEKEESLGRAFVKSLNDEQRKKAVIMEKAPKDIVNVPGRNDTKAEGIAYSALNDDQKKELAELVKLYLFRCRPDVAEGDWARVQKGGLEKLHFAWAGGFEPGQGHYYRVQAGNFVLEYDNVQNGANHPHTVWRDFDRDFGLDELARHYKESHKP
jgi:hypothetical protein